MRTRILRYARLWAGWCLVVVGAITAPTPLPIGYVLIVFGLAILVHESRFVRRGVRRLRARYPRAESWLLRAKHYAPGFARRVIELTDPAPRRERAAARAALRAARRAGAGAGAGENGRP